MKLIYLCTELGQTLVKEIQLSINCLFLITICFFCVYMPKFIWMYWMYHLKQLWFTAIHLCKHSRNIWQYWWHMCLIVPLNLTTKKLCLCQIPTWLHSSWWGSQHGVSVNLWNRNIHDKMVCVKGIKFPQAVLHDLPNTDTDIYLKLTRQWQSQKYLILLVKRWGYR